MFYFLYHDYCLRHKHHSYALKDIKFQYFFIFDAFQIYLKFHKDLKKENLLQWSLAYCVLFPFIAKYALLRIVKKITYYDEV